MGLSPSDVKPPTGSHLRHVKDASRSVSEILETPRSRSFRTEAKSTLMGKSQGARRKRWYLLRETIWHAWSALTFVPQMWGVGRNETRYKHRTGSGQHTNGHHLVAPDCYMTLRHCCPVFSLLSNAIFSGYPPHLWPHPLRTGRSTYFFPLEPQEWIILLYQDQRHRSLLQWYRRHLLFPHKDLPPAQHSRSRPKSYEPRQLL